MSDLEPLIVSMSVIAVPKGQHTMVAAALRQAFQQPDHAAARTALLHVAEMMCARWPKLAAFIIDSEADVLAYTSFPSQHQAKLHSTNSLERLNKEVKRRADAVGIFPNEESIIRLIGAALLEANDDWQLQHRYMQIEGMAELNTGRQTITCSKLHHEPHDPMATSNNTRISTTLTDMTPCRGGIRRRSATRPEPSNPTRLHAFLPKSMPSTTIPIGPFPYP